LTKTDVTDNYQNDLSHSLHSFSVGFRGAVNVTEKIRINASYSVTFFEDWTHVIYNDIWQSLGPITFARISYVSGIGVDFRF
jgi:long-chain fatty acid transport protein